MKYILILPQQQVIYRRKIWTEDRTSHFQPGLYHQKNRQQRLKKLTQSILRGPRKMKVFDTIKIITPPSSKICQKGE